MSLTSALFSGVSGLNSQSSVLGTIGDNIANVSTVGFKAGSTSFASLVTGAGTSTAGSGVTASTRLAVDQQGLIQSTGIATDIAISGQGFFVVKDNPAPGQGTFLYTRAGSFRQDQEGNFINSSGYVLQGYKLDAEGGLPAASTLLTSLSTVNTRDINGLAVATTSISLGLNLDASQTILTGAGDALKPVSTLNTGVGLSDVLAPTTGELEDGDAIDITLGDLTAYSFQYGGLASSDAISTTILGAATSSGKFALLSGAGGTGLHDGDGFSITTASGGTKTFTYNFANADETLGTFNSLDTLAATIDASPGLSARVASDGKLYIAPDDATQAMTIANLANTGHLTSLIAELGATFISTTAQADRFASLQGLKELVNEKAGITATSESDASDASLSITVDDPLQTVLFQDHTGNGGVLLAEFGFPAQTAVNVAAGNLTTPLDAIYDTTVGRDMASGDITPAFSRNIRVFDGQGNGHDLIISFAKSANNTWLVEMYASNLSDVTVTNSDGLLASGTIRFNGDGSLRQVSSSLTTPLPITWTNGTGTSEIALELGTAGQPLGTEGATTIGLTNGLSQFAGTYNVQFANQNGSGSGLLSSIEINDKGFVIANFTNGQSRNVFQIPLASFPNPNGLSPKAGNAFSSSDGSGTFSLALPGGSGVGVISTSALESANTDLATELTKMIVSQRAFQANTKIITTINQLLDDLNRVS